MERDGIYFFFQQGEDNEKLIITDSSTYCGLSLPAEKTAE
jgi:hypothetical protein